MKYLLLLFRRRSLRPFGVSVHMIEPGSCVTGLNFMADAAKLKEALSGTWKRLHDEVIVEYGRDYYDKCKCCMQYELRA